MSLPTDITKRIERACRAVGSAEHCVVFVADSDGNYQIGVSTSGIHRAQLARMLRLAAETVERGSAT